MRQLSATVIMPTLRTGFVPEDAELFARQWSIEDADKWSYKARHDSDASYVEIYDEHGRYLGDI